ncbi:hypothetical protein WJX77_010912 [Trebouxia sp. C0004]
MHGGEVAFGVLVAEVVTDVANGVEGGDCVVGGGEDIGEDGDDDEDLGGQVHRPQADRADAPSCAAGRQAVYAVQQVSAVRFC